MVALKANAQWWFPTPNGGSQRPMVALKASLTKVLSIVLHSLVNVYLQCLQNLFDNCNSFVLPQKILQFFVVFDGNSAVIICS